MQSTTMEYVEFAEVKINHLTYLGEELAKALFFQNHSLYCLFFVGFTLGF